MPTAARSLTATTLKKASSAQNAPSARASKGPKAIASTQSLSSFVKGICDIMRRSNCASALQYVPELTWILFLRILDAQELREAERAQAQGRDFSPALREPYRWQDWAAPFVLEADRRTPEGRHAGWKREALKGRVGDMIAFVNKELLPHLHQLDVLPDGQPNPDASPKQRVIGRIMTAVDKLRVDNEANLLDILDRVDEISIDHIDDQHFFTLSQVYEDLLLKMGEKNSDGGQFFTPREVVRAMVGTLQPQLGETVYDPCCGTGGFLAQAYDYLKSHLDDAAPASVIHQLKTATFHGREKENLVFPIALANLVLHGIDQPRLWHGNTLSNAPTYEALFAQAPTTFDVILTNPPFGGKEGKVAQDRYAFKTSSTQVLFMQHIVDELASPGEGETAGGRCGVVLDEGFLFRTNESAFVETKRKLLDECDVWCIVSLPGGVFSTAGAGVKTNLVFFTKGRRTERIWYYDLSHVKMGKKQPMTLAHFGWSPDFKLLTDAELPASLVGDWTPAQQAPETPFPSFARLLAKRDTEAADSDFSWTLDMAARRAAARQAMAPHEAEVARSRDRQLALKEELALLRKVKAPEDRLLALQTALSQAEREGREAQAKADALDAAVFDLKAVNPHARMQRDERTPAQILEAIEAHGRTLQQALSALRALM
ncbi:SAM-dependent DNA methyltransferase [Ideonella sp. 4Y11]|uniref:site-specific DNA-methyltransferase (adenine-specific) n=1 Tax=Ideonella aquatica TaxID=2824119 RepID=A0A941BL37_9BURK|nr:N-6 DNA methylase [Ideonella aquatica]MBQ0961062.1 SAM-dependent DNA methyltransferase [Ideonella aquatica]